MGYQLGIDVGTTYTAAAVCRSAGRYWVEPEVVTLGTRAATVPSVLFMASDGGIVVGEAAERRALTDPDRVVREFKRRIGDPTPIVVGGRSWAPEELSARLVRWVVDRVAEREGGPAAQIAVTHPAAWGSHKKDLLTAALAAQGLRVTLLAEPQAAAFHYATQERVAPGSTIAVYDLGGGTFDAAVVRKADRSEAAFGATGFGLLGRPEGLDRLGGIDFDDVVFDHVREGLPAAFSDLDDTDTGVLSAVARVRRECTEAKEALSADTDVSIPVLLPAGGGSVRLHRTEFESMIRPQVEETVDALRSAVHSAGCRPGELSAVLLVGGSSRIPLVAQLVSEGLARPVAVDTDPKNAIAKGAALSVSPMPTASWPEVAIPPVPRAERGADGATTVLIGAAVAAAGQEGGNGLHAGGALGAVAAGAGMAAGRGPAGSGRGGAGLAALAGGAGAAGQAASAGGAGVGGQAAGDGLAALAGGAWQVAGGGATGLAGGGQAAGGGAIGLAGGGGQAAGGAAAGAGKAAGGAGVLGKAAGDGANGLAGGAGGAADLAGGTGHGAAGGAGQAAGKGAVALDGGAGQAAGKGAAGLDGGVGQAAGKGAGRPSAGADVGSPSAGRHAAPEHEQIGRSAGSEPARPAVHPAPAPAATPEPEDVDPAPSRPRSVALMVGAGLLAVAVIVLVALLVPRLTSSDSPGIVTESGASGAASEAPQPAAPAPAPSGAVSGGSGGAGGHASPPSRRSQGGGVAPAPVPAPAPAPAGPVVPAPAPAPAPAPVPTTAPPVVPPSAAPPSQAPAPAPQPAPSDTPGAIGPDPTGGGTTTPVGGTDSTGSNTPVGTGNHGHGGRNPSSGDKPAGDTSVPATQNPTATAETAVV